MPRTPRRRIAKCVSRYKNSLSGIVQDEPYLLTNTIH